MVMMLKDAAGRMQAAYSVKLDSMRVYLLAPGSPSSLHQHPEASHSRRPSTHAHRCELAHFIVSTTSCNPHTPHDPIG